MTYSAKPEKPKISFLKLFLFIFMVGFVLIWLLPVFGGVLTALRSMDDLTINGFWALPQSISLKHFAEAWTRGQLGKYLLGANLSG